MEPSSSAADPALVTTISPGAFVVRVLWVALQIFLVIYMGEGGVRFFYQNF